MRQCENRHQTPHLSLKNQPKRQQERDVSGMEAFRSCFSADLCVFFGLFGSERKIVVENGGRAVLVEVAVTRKHDEPREGETVRVGTEPQHRHAAVIVHHAGRKRKWNVQQMRQKRAAETAVGKQRDAFFLSARGGFCDKTVIFRVVAAYLPP